MEIPASYRWLSKWPGDGGRHLLSRRMFVSAVSASLLTGQNPEISSFDLSLLDGPIVPVELFFVREHFPAPNVSSAGWKLSIRGAVATRLQLSYDELLELRRKTLPVTLECAENPSGGGLVSHAEWTGFPLASLLETAKAGSEAKFVRLSGADGFARSIPITKAKHPDTLLAYSINGEKLPVNHGFPLRAVIPGWYGMDSVKWLRDIEVLADEGVSPSMQEQYVRMTRSLLAGPRPAGPVTAMNVNSVFSRPVDAAILVSRRFLIRGAAWAGENPVARVEVTTDGGKIWHSAHLEGEPKPYSWALWAFDWKIPAAGSYELSVRAADEKGRQQPAERAPERADPYELNTPQSIRITVT